LSWLALVLVVVEMELVVEVLAVFYLLQVTLLLWVLPSLSLWALEVLLLLARLVEMAQIQALLVEQP
jgi:hypothetical protein